MKCDHCKRKNPNAEKWLYDYFKPKTAAIKVVLQMAVGVALIAMLALKLYIFFWRAQDYNWFFQFLANNNPLKVTGYALAISASVELAYMLFTPGPDEAVEPVILGLSSAALIVSASEPIATYENAVLLLVLAAGITILFRVRRRNSLDSERDERRAIATENIREDQAANI